MKRILSFQLVNSENKTKYFSNFWFYSSLYETLAEIVGEVLQDVKIGSQAKILFQIIH